MPGDFGGDFSGGASVPISYSAFQGYVADYLGRSDLTNNIPFFISWFEAWANRRFRVRQQEAVATLTTSGGSVALPTDYLSWRRMTWTGSTGVELRYKTPTGIRTLFPTAVAGIPSSFSIEGLNIITRDMDDTANAFAFEYFQRIESLANTQNWLYLAHPDLYLFGTLAEAYGFQKDPENMALWGSRRNDAADEVERLDVKTRGPSAITIAAATP